MDVKVCFKLKKQKPKSAQVMCGVYFRLSGPLVLPLLARNANAADTVMWAETDQEADASVTCQAPAVKDCKKKCPPTAKEWVFQFLYASPVMHLADLLKNNHLKTEWLEYNYVLSSWLKFVFVGALEKQMLSKISVKKTCLWPWANLQGCCFIYAPCIATKWTEVESTYNYPWKLKGSYSDILT